MRGQKKNFNLKLYKNVAIIVFSAVVLAIIMSVIFKFNNREEAPKIITKSTHLKKLKKSWNNLQVKIQFYLQMHNRECKNY